MKLSPRLNATTRGTTNSAIPFTTLSKSVSTCNADLFRRYKKTLKTVASQHQVEVSMTFPRFIKLPLTHRSSHVAPLPFCHSVIASRYGLITDGASIHHELPAYRLIIATVLLRVRSATPVFSIPTNLSLVPQPRHASVRLGVGLQTIDDVFQK